jgi:hypothetical protein
MPEGQKYILAGNGRLFSPDNHEYYRPGRLTKKQKRHFMKLKSGMTLAVGGKERLCFLTLTKQSDKEELEHRLKRMQNNDLPTVAGTYQKRFRWRKLKPILKPKLLVWDKTLQSTFECDLINKFYRLFLRYQVTAISITE